MAMESTTLSNHKARIQAEGEKGPYPLVFCSHPIAKRSDHEPGIGFEPMTFSLQERCSAS
jgi:hypothetical protein